MLKATIYLFMHAFYERSIEKNSGLFGYMVGVIES